MRRRVAATVGALALAVAGAGLGSTGATAAPALKVSATKAATNTLGVSVVRFNKGVSKAAMKALVVNLGGEVVTDLSGLRRLGVTSDKAGFVKALKADSRVAAVWTDRFIPLQYADAGDAGALAPAVSSPTGTSIPDPWHDLDSFLDESAPGVLQWDDDANGARGAWATTTGSGIRVAVLDSGLDGAHKEVAANYDKQNSANTIPCNLLTRQFGPKVGERDCSMNDTNGHGTWVGSRIGGAVNGFASNGVAPDVQLVGYKVLSTSLGGGLTTWIVDGMYRACNADVDLINMSLGGRNAVGVDDEDTLLWVDAVDYCRSQGTAIVASAGNNHVRVNSVNLTIGGRALTGIGQVDAGDEGVQSIVPGDTVANNDLRGTLVVPGGIPGVIMVSSTSNANGDPNDQVAGDLSHLASRPTVGATDQLAYYSNYGSRIDIGAPGGARKYGVPRYDGGTGDVLYGGWGELAGLSGNGEICRDPATASLLTFACFKITGASFGWLQGTSMSAPNATGVAALTLAAHADLQGNPDALLAHLQATARTDMVNETGPNDPTDTGLSFFGNPCASGWCHLDYYPGGAGNPISFGDAYGPGMVDAEAAVGS
jgi:subtilisin family serine protease